MGLTERAWEITEVTFEPLPDDPGYNLLVIHRRWPGWFGRFMRRLTRRTYLRRGLRD